MPTFAAPERRQRPYEPDLTNHLSVSIDPATGLLRLEAVQPIVNVVLASDPAVVNSAALAAANAAADAVDATMNDAIGIITNVNPNDSTDNTAIIQAAVAQGGKWRLPRTATGRYYIAGEIDLEVPGTELDLRGAPIRQNQVSAFNALAADLMVNGLDTTGDEGAPNFTGLNDAWEGSITASRWCGINIYATAHRLRVPWMRARGMSSAIRSGGWDPNTAAEATYRTEDVEIGIVLVDRVEFGAALKNLARGKIGHVAGRYGNTATAPRPPHLLYFADGAMGHEDIIVGSAVAYDGVGGHAFQVKGVSGGAFGPLQARNSRGLLNIMDADHLTFAAAIAYGDTFDGTQGGAVMFDETTDPTSFIEFQILTIDMAVDKPAFNIVNGDHITVEKMLVTTAHTVTGGANDYDVIVGGDDNEVKRLDVINAAGAAKAWKAATIWGTGLRNRIKADRLENVRVGLDGRTTVDGVLEYDLDRITLHSTDGLYKLTRNPASGSVTFIAPQTNPLRDRAVLAADFSIASGSTSALTAALTGQLWTLSAGLWVTTADRKARISADLAGARAFIDPATTAHRVSVDLTHGTTDGLIIKATADRTSYLWVQLTNTAIDLKITNDASLATVARTIQPGRTYRVEASYYDGVVEVFLDGVSILTHTLDTTPKATFNAATLVGLRTSQAASRFANLKVQAI